MDNIRIKPVWKQTKEEIWKEKFEPMISLSEPAPANSTRRLLRDVAPAHPMRKRSIIQLFNYSTFRYAASLLIPILLICHFYTESEQTARGEQATLQLPDHSTVTLNADSKISYKPFYWLFSRTVKLEGEGFFTVKPGSRFKVQAGNNQVRVLGTTFNVYTRPGLYRVACLTGKVEVQAGDESVVLHPNMQATIRLQHFSLDSDMSPTTATGWMQGKFEFVETPLQEVLEEIERQYNIHITPVTCPNYYFTGNFSKTDNLKEILEIIGKPFGLTLAIE